MDHYSKIQLCDLVILALKLKPVKGHDFSSLILKVSKILMELLSSVLFFIAANNDIIILTSVN